MPNDAWVEQGGRFERVLVEEIGSDQAALRLVQYGMRFQRLFHLRSARLEDLEQVSVTPLEVLQHLGQLPRGNPRVEPNDSVDDMVRPRLIGRIEVSGLRRRLEGPDDDPGRIGTQMQCLAIRRIGIVTRWLPGVVRGAITRSSRPLAIIAARLNCRISTRPRRYDSTDSAPLFALGRSGWSPSEQLPVSASIIVVCRSFSPRNQSNARIAPVRHSAPRSTRHAERQAEIVAAASTGCWSKASGFWRILPKLLVPTGLK